MDNVTLARASMGTSLGFHIVFAVLGVGMPVLMSVAEGLGLWRHDEVWLRLARRWAKAFGIVFAVGAVSGTALSFELGLLWPRFMAFSGAAVGLPFSAEGFAFFLEAIFLGLYLYGWDRLRPGIHWLCSLPIVLSGAASSLFVVMVNAWMNTPVGFRLDHGQLVSVNPLAAAFNPSTPTEDTHMLVSAYVVTGFVVAAVYAAGMLRGRAGDPIHRRALPLALAMAAVAIVLAGITGDLSARFVGEAQPIKFAAQEGLFPTERGAPLTVGGIPLPSQRRTVLGLEIPYGLSLLDDFNPNSVVRGLDAFPSSQWPNPVVVHFSFDTMVGAGLALGALAAAYWAAVWRGWGFVRRRWFLFLLALGGPASVAGMEAGWFDTEFGRQPWVVYKLLRTSQAATTAPGLWFQFIVFSVIYVALAVTLVQLLLLLAQREREAGAARPASGQPAHET